MESILDDKLLEFGLPASLDAERLVLGGALMDRDLFPQVAAALNAEDFSIEKHRRIFSAMETLHAAGKVVDRITVAHELHRLKLLELCDGISYLVDLDNGLASVLSVDAYIGIVKNKSVLRRTILECQKVINQCLEAREESANVLAYAESVLRDLSQEQAPKSSLKHIGEVIANSEHFFEPYRRPQGIPLPWANVKRYVRGLRPGDLILLAARPGRGKSAFAGQVVEHAASQNKGAALLYSLEMNADDNAQRMVCGVSGIPSNRLYNSSTTREERQDVVLAADHLTSLPIYIDDSSMQTIPSLHAALRKFAAHTPIGVVVIDYLGLLESSGRAENRNQEVSKISRSLKLMAKEFHVPFLVLSQFSRAAADVEPKLHHLRESGSLEQDADIVMFLHDLATNEDMHSTGWESKLIIAKQRKGPTGRVKLWFNRQTTRFEDQSGDDE